MPPPGYGAIAAGDTEGGPALEARAGGGEAPLVASHAGHVLSRASHNSVHLEHVHLPAASPPLPAGTEMEAVTEDEEAATETSAGGCAVGATAAGTVVAAGGAAAGRHLQKSLPGAILRMRPT